MSWHTGRLCGFDLETTGTDVETDRIVTACVIQGGGGLPVESVTWLADPGIDIPGEAARIHGITTDKARAEGRPAAVVVEEVTTTLAQAAGEGVPIVAMNAAFDLTLLDREAARHGVPRLFDISVPVVIDPRVLDRATDPYRPGTRRLEDLCRHYRVSLDGAHTADADARAACHVAWRIAQRSPVLAGMEPGELHEKQVRWAREQSQSLAAYFARTPGKEHLAASVHTEWPLIPARETLA